MAEEELKKLESESPSEPPLAPTPELIDAPKEVAEEKSVIPAPPPAEEPPPVEEKPDESKTLAVVEKVPDAGEGKSVEGSINRDAVLERVATEKRMSLIKAWEESEKSKVENKAQKKLSAVGAWEHSREATVEAELKKIEEKLEKEKAEYVEKMKNKVALIHKAAAEKRAMIEAKRGEDLLKAEEMAAKYRATGSAPKKLLGWF
ncbi:hypothetical protein F0562_031252 [Nyssa sinensis]|uniref:Remorin C-terminal domain-containing protein n=1 Tax=Nyssa sinensis TaxID=561372 RepID=A0A5J5ARM6_9ASTE|nr:hypothetical protein F0562_031252 [Nyssa sinensis]